MLYGASVNKEPVVAVRGDSGQEWLAQQERGSVVTIRVIAWIALRLGRRAARLLLHPICLYFLVFSHGSRPASRGYLARVLGRRPGIADVFRHYHAFASCVLDRVFLLNDRLDLFDLHIHDEDMVIDILKRGSGCFLLGAHLGSFEVMGALGRRVPDLRVSMAMYEENAQKIGAVLKAINPRLAIDVIGLGQFGSMIALQEQLDRGHAVGVLADRGLDDEKVARYPFLGAPAAFPLGPFRMLALMKRPVVLMFGLYRGGRRYDIFFEMLTDPADWSADHRAEEIDKTMRRYVERLEHYCRMAPFNWFNFYDFWK
jgi:predicted LPLAT superfamily acyltransferase